MKFQKHWISRISTACCFLLMLALFSSVAFAAEADSTVRFAEVYGLELADGESKKVSFCEPSGASCFRFSVTNATTVADVVSVLGLYAEDSGLTSFYDAASGRFGLIGSDGNGLGFYEVSLNGEVLAPKPSVSTPVVSAPAMSMSALLSAITEVFQAAIGWMASVGGIVVSTPLFLIPIVFAFVGVGISLFSRLLRV